MYLSHGGTRTKNNRRTTADPVAALLSNDSPYLSDAIFKADPWMTVILEGFLRGS
jgi:hypothetical protein